MLTKCPLDPRLERGVMYRPFTHAYPTHYANSVCTNVMQSRPKKKKKEEKEHEAICAPTEIWAPQPAALGLEIKAAH